MPVHLLAYQGSLVLNTATTMSGLVDPVITRSATSSLYILPQRLQALAGIGMSAGLQRIQLSSPTLRQVNIPYFRPVIQSLRPTSGAQICALFDQPLMLPALEELGPIATTNTNPGPETGTFLLWVADQVLPVPPGDILTARATATFAATANTWSLGSFTFEQSLPNGLYALVGSEHVSTTAIAHRWAFPNQLFRPGSMSHQGIGDEQDFRLLTRRLGNYGNFLNTAPPQIEVLCTAADNSHEIYMQLVKLSGSVPA